MPAAEIPGRLLIEKEPHAGCWNMAYDEALLEAAANRGEAILRIYRWSEPTLSLGYFQRPSELSQPLRALPRVRRLSGGGAILHHHEWTYSCAVPKEHAFARRAEVLYEEVHESLIESLGRHSVAATLRGESVAGSSGRLLCFLRSDPRDVLVGGGKIVGSAQRRRRGAVLQHGSVLLRNSPFAPDVPGLIDLVSDLPHDELFAAETFAEVFGARIFNGTALGECHPHDTAFAQVRAPAYAVS